jgi:hypothetical protein
MKACSWKFLITKRCPTGLRAGLGLLSVLALTPGTTRANVLFNANLDDLTQSPYTIQQNASPIGWNIEATEAISGSFLDGADSEPWCNVLDTGGSGLFFKPFHGDVGTGDLLSVHFDQDNPATPNTKFTLSFYAAAEANYSGFFKTNSPVPQTLAVIEFLDSTGTPITTNSYDLVAAGLPNSGPGSMSSTPRPK